MNILFCYILQLLFKYIIFYYKTIYILIIFLFFELFIVRAEFILDIGRLELYLKEKSFDVVLQG